MAQRSVTVAFDVPATMRDGTVLRANVYQPTDDGPWPVLLVRTPYSKDLTSVNILDPLRMAQQGFIVVVQDVRGRFASAGEWYPLHNEALDGYDAVEWAAELPGSSGAVGMYGASYVGFTQWQAAKGQPPHLKALMPTLTWASSLDGVAYRGGAFELGLNASWHLPLGLDLLARIEREHPAQLGADIQRLIGEIDTLRSKGFWSYPLREFAPFRDLPIGDHFLENLDHPFDPTYYDPLSPAKSYAQVEVPTLNIAGWYDIFLHGTLQNYRGMRDQGPTPEARQARLIVGPWSHITQSNVVGEIDWGFTAMLDFLNGQTDAHHLAGQWFGQWLRKEPTQFPADMPVLLFVMGENIWRPEADWPLARAVATSYNLHSSGQANSAAGDGSLSLEPAPSAAPPDHFRYDPADPVPTVGGALLMHPLYGAGPKDQRPVEARQDVLVYTTPPLTEELEVTGPISVKLWASSDAPDTDWVARLVDVHPDGYAQNLTDGILRARFRDGATPQLLTPGQPYCFMIDLWATSNLFKVGHCIRLDVTSSNFPRWDRNPNTGSALFEGNELRVAHQTILHDADHPSCVVLPVVPRRH